MDIFVTFLPSDLFSISSLFVQLSQYEFFLKKTFSERLNGIFGT
jgi:hypothetical protein